MLIGAAMCVLAFFMALGSDYLETRYVRAVHDFEASDAGGDAVARERARERAARSSVAMWCIGMLGLIAVLEVGWWIALPEGVGLYVGTKLAMRRRAA